LNFDGVSSFLATQLWSLPSCFDLSLFRVIEDFLCKMSDTEERDDTTEVAEAEAEVEAPKAPTDGKMDLTTALQEVLKTALIYDGLARGIHECAKALDKRQARMCVLAKNCDEPIYVKLVEALCKEHGINLIRVDDNKKLGEWVGLCKIDKEGKPRKVVRCSCVVVKEYGKEATAHEILRKYFKSHGAGGAGSDDEE